MALRIEDYALIGDCETVALVGRNGSIDWLCWPDFSSPACFAALVGTHANGRWLIAPRERSRKIIRRYRDHTLILETRFETDSGVLLLTDFMPVREHHSDIVRIARCVHGRVPVQMELRVRFDFGRTLPWTGPREGNSWAAAAGTNILYLRTQQSLRTEDSTAFAEFTLKAGEQRSFVLTQVGAQEAPSRRVNSAKALEQTEEFWTRWCAINTYQGPWQEEIERSLITLKALTYRPSGGIVAAPTTSLPERLGGDRNWDYRFCWLRDAAFTLESLLSVGYHDEARAWQKWLFQAVGSDVSGLQIMYGMRGERHLPESELPWLCGYRKSVPVRMGNNAFQQAQLDVYGEVADALVNMKHANVHLEKRVRYFLEKITAHVATITHKPAFGIWERRDQQDHFVYSKVMAWLALDRGVKSAENGEISGNIKEWKRKRGHLHSQICRRGFNRKLGSFVQSYGSNKLDASSLLIPTFGFLPFEDERIRGTLQLIQKRLTKNGLVYRYLPDSKEGNEAAFLACSFWLVQNLAGVGRRKEAVTLFEKLLQLRNDVGLLSEEYDPENSRFMGNYPQALSHISLINAARALSLA